MKAEKALFCELAPIDIDPIHGMNSLQSPPRQEYKDFVYKWAKVIWLSLNGEEIAHRQQDKLWWNNDYRFEWDVDLTGKLKQGKNIVALRVDSRHHFAGMFRRPFIYAAR
ncbi:MAG: hypothetical protein WBM35_09805 [Candidatus Electrothrix sp.]